MLTFWRVCAARRAATAFDGEGARLFGGRWNPKGVRVVYCASSLSLATLEAFVHFDPRTAPAVEQVYVRATIPDDVPVETLDQAKLPTDWRAYPAPTSLAALGAEWALSRRTVALLVPSAVTPIEDNILLNPEHPDTAKVEIGPAERFEFDPRMFRGV
jgi:RES domain-containing protein